MIEVEICCNSAASAAAAKAGGAQRIELCRDLECGGLTPSDEDIAYCVRELGLRTHVLIRPRPGDFAYSREEMAEVRRSVERCRDLGAHAVVVGFLTPKGRIDTRRTRQIVDLAKPMEVTFHRAFDEITESPIDAIIKVRHCGCTRILTSGGAPTAPEGLAQIRLLRRLGFIKILAGSGITPQNVAQIILDSGVREVHSSCKTTLPDGTLQTSPRLVRALLDQVQLASITIENLNKNKCVPVIS